MRFVGDVFLDKAFQLDLESNDVLICNLEYPFSTAGMPAKNKVNLGADASFFHKTFEKNKVVAVSLANNHIMDYGEEAYLKTVEELDKNQIKYFGAGDEENNYNNPAIIDCESKKVALFGYSCPTTHPVYGGKEKIGSALLDINHILGDIKSAKETSDIIVLNLHWGDEEIKYPKPSDVNVARKLIDAGVDLIIGHHAHVAQSFEVYKGKYIFYGLGNFIFPDLKVPAQFDGTRFQRSFTKIQNSKNRQGLIVDMDEEVNISFQTSVFDGSSVSLKERRVPRWVPESDRQYRLYYKFWTKLRMLELFFKNPRIPSVRQIKLLLNMKGIE